MNHKSLILSICALLVLNVIFDDSFAESNSNTKNTNNVNPKISQIIQNWQISNNSELFAQQNGLSYQDGRILVYVYLNSTDSISSLSEHVSVTSSAKDIAAVFLSSDEITFLSQLDFVKKIESPKLAHAIEIQSSNDSEFILNDWYYLLIPVGIAFVAILVFRKLKQ